MGGPVGVQRHVRRRRVVHPPEPFIRAAERPRTVTVTISRQIYDALGALARRRGQTVERYLGDFLDEYARDEWLNEWEEYTDPITGEVDYRRRKR